MSAIKAIIDAGWNDEVLTGRMLNAAEKEYAALVERVEIGREEKVSIFIKVFEDWIGSNPVSVYINGDYDVFPEQVKQLAEALAAALDRGKGTA